MMPGKAKEQPPKAVIAIPSEPVRKAGGRELEFKSVLSCARYFGLHPSTITRVLVHGTKRLPTFGYYFDYKM